jgi:hypothetical protein
MPPTYTHTYEVKINMSDIEKKMETSGQVLLNGSNRAGILADEPDAMYLDQHGGIQKILDFFVGISKEYGEIEKIIVEKKL